MKRWIALYLEPLTLGLAIALFVGVIYALAEAANIKRRGK